MRRKAAGSAYSVALGSRSFPLWESASCHSESSHFNSSGSCFHRGGLEGLVAAST